MLQVPQTEQKQLKSCEQQRELKPVFKANFGEPLIVVPFLMH